MEENIPFEQDRQKTPPINFYQKFGELKCYQSVRAILSGAAKGKASSPIHSTPSKILQNHVQEIQVTVQQGSPKKISFNTLETTVSFRKAMAPSLGSNRRIDPPRRVHRRKHGRYWLTDDVE